MQVYIQIRALKNEVEKSSMWIEVGHGSVDPKREGRDPYNNIVTFHRPHLLATDPVKMTLLHTLKYYRLQIPNNDTLLLMRAWLLSFSVIVAHCTCIDPIYTGYIYNSSWRVLCMLSVLLWISSVAHTDCWLTSSIHYSIILYHLCMHICLLTRHCSCTCSLIPVQCTCIYHHFVFGSSLVIRLQAHFHTALSIECHIFMTRPMSSEFHSLDPLNKIWHYSGPLLVDRMIIILYRNVWLTVSMPRVLGISTLWLWAASLLVFWFA